LAEFITALAKEFPEKKLALSCAPVPRELEKMEQLLARLPAKPWRVFAGNLNLMQLTAVIANSALHFCGDTGPLHLAVMTNTPTVAWFWPNPGRAQWLPVGDRYRVLVGVNELGASHLSKIETGELIRAAKAILEMSGIPARAIEPAAQ